MHRSRLLAAVAVTGLVAMTSPSFAARKPPPPKPVCHPVQDNAGDAAYPQSPGSSEDSLDIVRGEIASDLTRLTLWIVVKGPSDLDPVTGFFRAFRFSVAGAPTANYVAARWDPVQHAQKDPTFEWGNWGADTGYSPQSNSAEVVTGTYLPNREVHITVKLAALGVKVVKGTPVSKLAIEIKAYPEPYYGQGLAKTVDTAESNVVYGIGNPSCIKVGT